MDSNNSWHLGGLLVTTKETTTDYASVVQASRREAFPDAPSIRYVLGDAAGAITATGQQLGLERYMYMWHMRDTIGKRFYGLGVQRL